MSPNSQAEARRWMRQAEADLEAAQYLSDGKWYNLACFLSQQAGEKGVKAFLFSQGAEDVWGYSLVDLCEDAKLFDPQFNAVKPDAILLDKWHDITRYPNFLPGGAVPVDLFEEADASRAIELAQEVLYFVKERVP